MTGTRDDVDLPVGRERARLLSVLEGLDDAGWRTPSLCAGWSVRDLAVHLLMPYELSMPRFLALLARSRFSFDRTADRWARTDRRSPAEVVAALLTTLAGRTAALDELTGDGVPEVRARLRSAAGPV